MAAICQRCWKEANCTQMSFFNTQMCCMKCIEEERKHPKYAEAKAAEEAALKAGNFNFQGIGYPSNR